MKRYNVIAMEICHRLTGKPLRSPNLADNVKNGLISLLINICQLLITLISKNKVWVTTIIVEIRTVSCEALGVTQQTQMFGGNIAAVVCTIPR